MSKSIKRPAFFKVFLEQFSAEMMEIPKSFCNKLIKKKWKVVYLTGPNGDTWKMDLIIKREEGESLFLGGEGWMTFLKHHNIVTGHFLVFKAEFNFEDGRMEKNVEEWFVKLKVKIYDETYCEKKKKKIAAANTTTDLVQLKPKQEDEQEAVYVQPLATRLPNHNRGRVSSSAASFPFFVGMIKQRRYYMIDEEFKREYLSDYGYSTEVVVSFGEDTSKVWSVTMVRHQDRDATMKIKKGWKKFAQHNHLTLGHILIFQMLSHFHFHIHKLQP